LFFFVVGLTLVGCGVAAAPGNASSCEEMAERLNKRFLVGSNRFDAGGSTGPEARDKLRDWMQSNGLLVQMCQPKGYPTVYGPCTDEFPGMDHIAASWVGLTDGVKEIVEKDLFEPFPMFPERIGVVFDTSYPRASPLCASPSDSASIGRLHDADGNPGCGPLKPAIDVGQRNTLDLLEAYLDDKKSGVRNATREFQVSEWVKRYNLGYGNETKGVQPFDQFEWWAPQGAGGNVSCEDLYFPLPTNYTGITPKDATSVDACSTFGPADVWTTAIRGSYGVFSKAGSWNPAEQAFLEVLGHPLCVDRSNSCVESGTCYPEAGPLQWTAQCTFGPEDFMKVLDIQVEMNSRPNPHDKGPGGNQWNELSLPLEANAPGGVEALFTYGNGFFKVLDGLLENNQPEAKAEFYVSQLPANATDYIAYAAKELAEKYYGGVPIVYVNPTKENALEGKIFGCSPDV